MTILAAATSARPETDACPGPVAGVRSSASIGVSRYCDSLASALRGLGVDYSVAERPEPGRSLHLHLANSSRRTIRHALRSDRFVVTLHDVEPRTPALAPIYRTVVYPRVVGRAEVTIVHSRLAADLLRRRGARPRRIEVVPHPATPPPALTRQAARAALGISDERLLAVLPGVIKAAKLVPEAIAALDHVGRDWTLLLAGRIRDRQAVAAARRAGALVIDRPDDRTYEAAIAAADVVLCLRADTVGETNGPLLDALGATRPVLATATGSIPEVARDAAHYVQPTAAAIADGLTLLSEPAERRRLSELARSRAEQLPWHAAAAAHAQLFAEVFDA